MSKNAFVLRGYLDGSTQTHDGDVIEDMTNETFADLERNNLVREATATEAAAFKKKQDAEPSNKAAPRAANKAAQRAANKAAAKPAE